MKFVASIDTVIYGIHYKQGDPVDVTKWTRKQELQFLGNGLISGQQFGSADLAGIIELIGSTGPAPVTVDPVTDKTTITIPVEPLDWLSDVDTSTTAPTNGQTLVYNSVLGLWKPATPAAGGGGLWAATVRQVAGQAIGNGVWTPDWTYLDFGVQEEGATGWVIGAPSKLVLPSVGQFSAAAGWAHDGANGGGTDTILGVRLYNADGSSAIASLCEQRAFLPYGAGQTTTISVKCTAAGQYLRVYVFHVTGGTRTTLPSNCFLSAHRTS